LGIRANQGTQRVVVRPVLSVQSPLVVKRAVQAGLGIARLPHSVVHNELADGSLHVLLNDANLCGDERTVWLLHSGRSAMPLALRGFVDFVVARYHQKSSIHVNGGEAPVSGRDRQESAARRVT
jgi:DNA-binding transcriptional LysR family regulator